MNWPLSLLSNIGSDIMTLAKYMFFKIAFRDQLRNLVTRVMNDAFSSLPADQLLNNLVR